MQHRFGSGSCSNSDSSTSVEAVSLSLTIQEALAANKTVDKLTISSTTETAINFDTIDSANIFGVEVSSGTVKITSGGTYI